jgi:hypothetical protein
MSTDQASTAAGAETTPRARVTREILASVLVGGVGPYVVYSLLRPHETEVGSLIAGGLLPVAWELVSLARHRRLDPVSTINLVALAVSIAIAFTGGSARMLLVKESFVTSGVGAGFLASLLLGRRPAHYYLARQFVTGNVQASVERYEASWERSATMRASLRTTTAVWGGVMLLELVARLWLVSRLTTEEMLVVGPLVFYATTGLLIAWTVSFSRRKRPKILAERNAV